MHIANGSPALLSVNEPDRAAQASMSPAAAAAAHKQHFKPFAGRVKIGSPAVTNSGQPGQGLEWLQQFLEACGDDCPIDFCAVHWYSEAQYSNTLFDHLAKANKICGGKPVALTEYAPTQGDFSAFVDKVVPEIEKLDYVMMHSFFMVSSNSLMTGPQSLSAFGAQYATVS